MVNFVLGVNCRFQNNIKTCSAVVEKVMHGYFAFTQTSFSLDFPCCALLVHLAYWPHSQWLFLWISFQSLSLIWPYLPAYSVPWVHLLPLTSKSAFPSYIVRSCIPHISTISIIWMSVWLLKLLDKRKQHCLNLPSHFFCLQFIQNAFSSLFWPHLPYLEQPHWLAIFLSVLFMF